MTSAAAFEHPGIAALFVAYDAALNAKDLDALARCYADDVLVYDVNTQARGYPAFREIWDRCFPYFTNPITFERRGVRVDVAETVACVSFLACVPGAAPPNDPDAKHWYRVTLGLVRQGDAWKIAHEHNSMPVSMETGQLAPILDEHLPEH